MDLVMRTTRPCAIGISLLLAVVLLASPAGAQETDAAEAAASSSEAYGVALTPPIYLINFLFLYMANPDLAASMPAYRAPLPPALFDCLEQNPAGCPYADAAPLLDAQQASPIVIRPDRPLLPLVRAGDDIRECFWPEECRESPELERLAPRRYVVASQINEPLGARRAARLARSLGMDDRMVLSDTEYRCLIGTSPRTPDQEIIFRCSQDLTSSRGSALVPLSSYGLSISESGDVRSNCAPDAPCLEFNALLAGPLEEIAFACGFLEKFTRMVTATPFLKFGVDGGPCQSGAEPACIVQLRCAGGAVAASGCQ